MNEQIEKSYTYHAPKDGQPAKYQLLRDKAKELAYLIDDLSPESRERSVAFTKLDETVMWANAAIARNEYEEKKMAEIKKEKAMISQPMAGLTDEQIVAARNKAIASLESKGYEIVNTLFTDEWYSPEKMTERGVEWIPLCFLAKSLENMSKCHVAYFAKGWENARGCIIEHAAALAYGLDIIEDYTEDVK